MRIRWCDLAPDEAFHLNRTPYRRGMGFPLHDHDFAEVFWVSGGPGHCRHLLPSGEHRLGVGDLVVVRPADVHGFAIEGDGFTLVNLAFPAGSLDHLSGRYGIELASAGMTPRPLRPESLSRLERAIPELAHGPRSLLALERFLLEIAVLLAPIDRAAVPADCPAWLEAVVRRLAAGELLELGVSEVAAAAGCSRGHLARACARHLGCTATELLNRHRLARARNRLAIEDTPIPVIAADCGLANLSHFYRLFQAAQGCTPRAWRMRSRQAG